MQYFLFIVFNLKKIENTLSDMAVMYKAVNI